MLNPACTSGSQPLRSTNVISSVDASAWRALVHYRLVNDGKCPVFCLCFFQYLSTGAVFLPPFLVVVVKFIHIICMTTFNWIFFFEDFRTVQLHGFLAQARCIRVDRCNGVSKRIFSPPVFLRNELKIFMFQIALVFQIPFEDRCLDPRSHLLR